jgi:hypothetical protein
MPDKGRWGGKAPVFKELQTHPQKLTQPHMTQSEPHRLCGTGEVMTYVTAIKDSNVP